MGRKKFILYLISSVVITFFLGFVGNYAKMIKVRRDFQMAVKNAQKTPTLGLIRIGPFPEQPTSKEIQLVEQAK